MELLRQTFVDAVGKGADVEVRSMVTTNGKDLMIQLACLSNDLGETPLILAIKGNYEKMVELLGNTL